jgi:MFS family permease
MIDEDERAAPPKEAAKETESFASALRVFRHRDFRLYWAALVVSQFGVAFQETAESWLIYRLTERASMLGLIAFVTAILAAPGSLLGGVLADRLPRRKLVLVTQTLLIFPSSILAYLIWTQQVQVWHVVAALAALGFISSIDMPARLAMIPALVGEADTMSAQGLSASARQGMRIAGPVLSGITIAWLGEALCFLVNGLTYGVMAIALLFMRPTPAPKTDPKRRSGLRGGLMGGIQYIFRKPAVLALMGMVIAQGLFLNPVITLLPVFAKDLLHVGPRGLGWLTGCLGVGALIATFTVANLGQSRRMHLIVVGSLIAPLALFGFAWSRLVVTSAALMVVVGLGLFTVTTVTLTTLLTIVPDELRGRVNSLGLLFSLGAPQVGALIAGFSGDYLGVSVTLTLTAILFVVSMFVVSLTLPRVRRMLALRLG